MCPTYYQENDAEIVVYNPLAKIKYVSLHSQKTGDYYTPINFTLPSHMST
jgi:hypothetical protein